MATTVPTTISTGTTITVEQDTNPNAAPEDIGTLTAATNFFQQEAVFEITVPEGASGLLVAVVDMSAFDIDLFVYGPDQVLVGSQEEGGACAYFQGEGVFESCLQEQPPPGTWTVVIVNFAASASPDTVEVIWEIF